LEALESSEPLEALESSEMDITSLQPAASSPAGPSQASPVSVQEAAQRRQLLQAAKSVNESGVLGQNQLEFLLDRQTHRAVIRVVDRTTQQVISQIPPEYVLRLAQDLGSSAEVMAAEDDT
jgi:flagellar protein FlaG